MTDERFGYSYQSQSMLGVLQATRNIRPGEEITITYCDPLQTRAERQAALQSKHNFICACPTCSLGPLRLPASDEIRAHLSNIRNSYLAGETVAFPTAIKAIRAAQGEGLLFYQTEFSIKLATVLLRSNALMLAAKGASLAFDSHHGRVALLGHDSDMLEDVEDLMKSSMDVGCWSNIAPSRVVQALTGGISMSPRGTPDRSNKPIPAIFNHTAVIASSPATIRVFRQRPWCPMYFGYYPAASKEPTMVYIDQDLERMQKLLERSSKWEPPVFAALSEEERCFVIKDCPGKGLGMVAKRDIAKGQLICSER